MDKIGVTIQIGILSSYKAFKTLDNTVEKQNMKL